MWLFRASSMIGAVLSLAVRCWMKDMFAAHGISEWLESDNGGLFVFQEFQDFAKSHGFCQLTPSPPFPQINRRAGSVVKIAKAMLAQEDPHLALLSCATLCYLRQPNRCFATSHLVSCPSILYWAPTNRHEHADRGWPEGQELQVLLWSETLSLSTACIDSSAGSMSENQPWEYLGEYWYCLQCSAWALYLPDGLTWRHCWSELSTYLH